MADLKGNKQSVKTPTMLNEDDTKGNKQSTKNPNILKEATSITKPKTQKILKEERTHQQEKNQNTSTKRNASNRSLLEGHPDKKHKDTTENGPAKNQKGLDYITSDSEEKDTSLIQTHSMSITSL